MHSMLSGLPEERADGMFAGAGPSKHSGPAEWEYVDPKGVVQGPFSSKDMLKWADAGFFTSDQQVNFPLILRLVSQSSFPSAEEGWSGQCSLRWPYKLPPNF